MPIIIILMGKKKIANKFASVKRMISSQDHRMYLLPYPANRTKKRRNSTTESEERSWQSKHPMMLKSNSCTLVDKLDQNSPRACFSHIITPWDHPTALSSIPTSSTSPSRINLTSSRQVWTVSSENASLTSLIAWWENSKNSE
jgi:hypothetical protein